MLRLEGKKFNELPHLSKIEIILISFFFIKGKHFNILIITFLIMFLLKRQKFSNINFIHVRLH